jgi:hypothetical protein
LLDPLEALPGVGPTLARLLEEATGGDRVFDLLLHLPERVVIRRRVASPEDAPPDQDCILEVEVKSLRAARARSTGRPYVEVRATSGGWPLTIRYMNGRLPWIQKLLPPGSVPLPGWPRAGRGQPRLGDAEPALGRAAGGAAAGRADLAAGARPDAEAADRRHGRRRWSA